MDRFDLDDEIKAEIRGRVLGDGFIKLVQSARRGGRTIKTSLRPVEIGGEVRFQCETTEDGRVKVRNIDADGIAGELEAVLAQKGPRDLHVMTAKGDLHLRVTRKGHALVSRSAEMNRSAQVRPHDRVKDVPLGRFDSSALLCALGIADGSGAIRASRRGKYDQVNEFLKVVDEVVAPASKASDATFTVVDCGCGKAYLTLALYYYLVHALKMQSVRVVGIDRRADVVAAARGVAAQLDVADNVKFVEADLGAVSLADVTDCDRVDMVISLHACDTATDEALAKGVEWKARYVLAAPCCQHELQKALSAGRDAGGEFAALLRQPILRERLCDILTDSFRAAIMRILGFRTQVVEFVDAEATARNIMLKCEYGVKPGQSGPVGEYLALRDYWKVTPWLEARLGDRLAKCLVRYE